MPVLSSAIASSAPIPSSVAASLIRMLWRAPMPVATATAVGVASPSASGQAITTALIAKVSVRMKSSSENAVQAPKVRRPTEIATTTSTAAARSASRWPGAFELWARSTRSMIWPSAVSAPILVASNTRRPRLVDRAADDLVARPLLDRDGLAGDQALVDRARAALHDAVDRDLVSRPEPDPVARRRSRRSAAPARGRRAAPSRSAARCRTGRAGCRSCPCGSSSPSSARTARTSRAWRRPRRRSPPPTIVSSTLASQAASTPVATSTDMLSARLLSEV